jgi:DNA-binding NarL/FixJ family response regulator
MVGTVSDLLSEKLRLGGAEGVLSEGDDPRALHELLGRVRQGGFRRSESFAQAVHFAPLLTTRQREVLDLVVAGQSDAQIASRLEISLTTAETHRRDLQSKLGVHSHHELILHAVRHGYVDATHITVSRPERQASRARAGAT